MESESPVPSAGPNVMTVVAYVETLDLDEHGLALAAIAVTLAQSLDAGAGMAAAAISKELRATLAELRPAEEDDGDVLPGLSAPILNTPNT